ncbi:hypothetical protein ABPG75_005849 [Micractinium tetrahymenae]
MGGMVRRLLSVLRVVLLAAGALSCAAQRDLIAHASAGASLEQTPDGYWLQRVSLPGVAQPGWAGLQDAFSRRLVTIVCPSSSQNFDVVGRSDRLSGTFWLRVKRCGSGREDTADGTAAAISACTVSLPAAGDGKLVVRQAASPDQETAPEPCTLIVQAGTSPPLLLACLLGVALLLRGQRWCRSRAAVALIRACCIMLPLLSAVVSAGLLASLAVASTAGVEWALAQLPVQPPKEMWGTAVVAIAAVTGIVTALSLICACMAVQLRGVAVAAAPWAAQLLGAALVCSNSQGVNWAIRGACILWLLRGSSWLKALGQRPAAEAAKKDE